MKTKILTRAYRFRLVPTDEQRELLARLAGTRRFIWNWALHRRKNYYAEHGKDIPAEHLSKELTALKSLPDTAWLKEMDSQVPQQALRDLQRAFVGFFEGRAKFPRFKGKSAGKQTFRIPQRIKTRSITHQPNVGEVYCPKVGWVRFKKSRKIEGEIKGATFKRDALGHWFVTLTCRFEVPQASLESPPPDPERTIGLDAGLKDFVVSSDGERVEPPKHYRRGEKKLRRAQRCLSRRKKGSKRREKAKRRVAKCHRKVANRRADFLHKLSTRLVKEHEAIYLEDLNLKGLTRTKLAKSFSDAAFGEFRGMLAYKSEWQDKRLIVVDRFFPSTRTCSVCGVKREAVPLSQRRWRCVGCATHHDRDLNAARNIRREGLGKMEAEGRPDSLNDRGADVRPPMRGPTVTKREESHSL